MAFTDYNGQWLNLDDQKYMAKDIHIAKTYATQIFMPTELHAGHGGPSMVFLFTCGEDQSYFCAFLKTDFE